MRGKRCLLAYVFFMVCFLITGVTQGAVKKDQIKAARGVIFRIAPDIQKQFVLKLIKPEQGHDVFELEGKGPKIIIRGSSGTALCSGFNYYLKTFCNCRYTWRGENLQFPDVLPVDFEKVRKVTPHQYRFMFNYCTFSYSMAFWGWEEWEKMIDWMALNGINMPLAITGQEVIWQRVFQHYGLNHEDLEDFFTGPGYNAWGRMGNLDGWGGPLPQSWIEQENKLQHKILQRERSLGMTPVLQGFSGHIPSALARKNNHLKIHQLSWCDFPKTHLLDWEEPLFTEIGARYIQEMKKEYGTDHYYAIDPFNEMTPTRSDEEYLKNMSRTIFNSMDKGDPQGQWLLMTWAFKSPDIEGNFWKPERTKAFFDGVPNDRMMALELHGEAWNWTGWYKQEAWYGKPWIWGVIQNFGDRVGMYGGLPQIIQNYQKVLESPSSGKLSGMGLFMEGLGYNPVVYELVADMIWEVPDLETWKWKYLKTRYGKLTPEVKKAWELLYDYYYTRTGLFTGTVITSRPGLNVGDTYPEKETAEACKYLLKSANDFKNCDAYQYDLVNLFREVFGTYAGHLVYEVKEAYRQKDVAAFEEKSEAFLTYIREMDELLGTREEFMLGKWVNDARKHGTTKKEKDLYEWNAKNIITLWGPKGHPGCGGLHGYAMKQWAGFFMDYCLPSWEQYFQKVHDELAGCGAMDNKKFYADIMDWEEQWTSCQGNYTSQPNGNSVVVAQKLWDKYGAQLDKGTTQVETPAGMAVNKKVSATSSESKEHAPQLAVDGKTNLHSAWWAAPYPQALTIDLEQVEKVYGFHVIPYWDWNRYYQYVIEVSNDGKEWRKVVNMSENIEPATSNGFQHIFKVKYPDGISARYVRINMLYNSANKGVHLVEFKVFKGEDLP